MRRREYNFASLEYKISSLPSIKTTFWLINANTIHCYLDDGERQRNQMAQTCKDKGKHI